MIIWLILYAIFICIPCSVVLYGMSLAFFQKEYPFLANKNRLSDIKLCLMMSIVGLLITPIWLTVMYFKFFRAANHGFLWWAPNKHKKK
jgi:hypothetical protein